MGYHNREVIVEIGCGMCPIFGVSSLVAERIEKGETNYIGVDCDREEVESWNKYPTVGIQFMVGSLGHIPLEDAIADEVWIRNVFGGSIKLEYELGSSPYRTGAGKLVIPSSGRQYFLDLARITKIGGRVIIVEEYTPQPYLGKIDYEEFGLATERLTAREFIERYRIDNDFFKNLMLRAEFPSNDFYAPAYFLVLTKT